MHRVTRFTLNCELWNCELWSPKLWIFQFLHFVWFEKVEFFHLKVVSSTLYSLQLECSNSEFKQITLPRNLVQSNKQISCVTFILAAFCFHSRCSTGNFLEYAASYEVRTTKCWAGHAAYMVSLAIRVSLYYTTLKSTHDRSVGVLEKDLRFLKNFHWEAFRDCLEDSSRRRLLFRLGISDLELLEQHPNFGFQREINADFKAKRSQETP